MEEEIWWKQNYKKVTEKRYSHFQLKDPDTCLEPQSNIYDGAFLGK